MSQSNDNSLEPPRTPGESIVGQVCAAGEAQVIWVLWATYGAFYFCRQNISQVVPLIGADLGYDKNDMGWVLGGLKIAYAIGQLLNGQLAERLSPRKMLAIGMLGSAALNVLFGFSTGLYFLFFVWACNGYCQSLGWTPCLRVAANWIPPSRRGRMIGILGTSYQVTAALTFIVSGYAAEWLGWRGALFVPATLLCVAALHMLLFLRETPEVTADYVLKRSESRGTWMANLVATLSNPALWFLAVSLFFLDACRYGFTDWGVTHLMEVQTTRVGRSAFQYAVLPAGGIAGALAAGWATDRFFHGRRAPVIVGLLVMLSLLALVYDSVAHSSVIGTIVLLAMIGFCIFGPQVLLVGTAPADLASRGTAAAAAGFVNFMGYMGAFTGDRVTPLVTTRYGWQTAVWCWAAWALAGALAAACLWNVKAKPIEPEKV